MMNPGCFGPGRLPDLQIMEEPTEMMHCLRTETNIQKRDRIV